MDQCLDSTCYHVKLTEHVNREVGLDLSWYKSRRYIATRRSGGRYALAL